MENPPFEDVFPIENVCLPEGKSPYLKKITWPMVSPTSLILIEN